LAPVKRIIFGSGGPGLDEMLHCHALLASGPHNFVVGTIAPPIMVPGHDKSANPSGTKAGQKREISL
jgi:hypothetical protein